jgi:hypothetical protein
VDEERDERSKWRLLPPILAWLIGVPFLAQALGLELGVDRSEERLNHGIAGLAGLIGGALAFWNGRPRSEPWTIGAAVVFLAGLHATTVHASVIRKVFEGDVPAGDALFHTSGGPPLLILGMWMLVTEMRPRHYQQRPRKQKNAAKR